MDGTSTFYNLSTKRMDRDDVLNHMYQFVLKDPTCQYRFSIGTDSQVHTKYTKFITALHLHRVGKGAWGCLSDHIQYEKVKSLREKIMLETTFSFEMAEIFNEHTLQPILNLVHKFGEKSGRISLEFHLDIGENGLTKEFIREMIERAEQTGMLPVIKPKSYAAFSYANRYTK